jgi:hypothetical protein
MDKDKYAQLFWADMQEFNNNKIKNAKVDEIISLLESAVTCTSWFTCENCKGYKRSIALIRYMEKDEREQHTGNQQLSH